MEYSLMVDDVIDIDQLVRSGAILRSFKERETIFKQGDAASELFVIQDGTVRIKLGDRLLANLYSGDLFGEMAIIEEGLRSATAVAATDVTLVGIPKRLFLSLIPQTPVFAVQVMRTLARRLRAANKSAIW